MPRVTGYMVDELTGAYITCGGTVRVSGDADMTAPLLDNGAFCIDDVSPGSYVVSIVDVAGYNPINKLLDIEEGEGDVDLGWFAGKAIPASMWGVHNDYEEAES